jgi:peptide/nickel transport system permease protein
MIGVLTLNFGDSTTYGIPASDLLLRRLPLTATLAGAALVTGVIVGVPLGLVAGYLPNSLIDRATLVLATSGQAIPIFVVGLGLIYLFAVNLHLLPAGGNEGWTSFVLPVAVIALWVQSTLLRLTRSSVREVLAQPYILLARAKGLTELQVIFAHALKNTLAPVLTFAGLQLGIMLTGTVVTESVFGLPGVGAATLEAVSERDLNVIQTAVMMFALTFVLIMFVVDMLHALLDPRVRLVGKH